MSRAVCAAGDAEHDGSLGRRQIPRGQQALERRRAQAPVERVDQPTQPGLVRRLRGDTPGVTVTSPMQ